MLVLMCFKEVHVISPAELIRYVLPQVYSTQAPLLAWMLLRFSCYEHVCTRDSPAALFMCQTKNGVYVTTWGRMQSCLVGSSPVWLGVQVTVKKHILTRCIKQKHKFIHFARMFVPSRELKMLRSHWFKKLVLYPWACCHISVIPMRASLCLLLLLP